MTITDVLGCETIFTQEVLWETSQQNTLAAILQQVQIVPNPSAATAYIWVTCREAQDVKLSVYNAQGQLLYVQKAFLHNGFQALVLPEQPSGYYRVVLQPESGGVTSLSWIIQK